MYRKNSDNPLAGTTFNRNVCTEVGTAKNDASGNITFDLGEQFATGGTGNEITYYLVEDAGDDSDITYDSSVYEIVARTQDKPTKLMTVPSKNIRTKRRNFSSITTRLQTSTGSSTNSISLGSGLTKKRGVSRRMSTAIIKLSVRTVRRLSLTYVPRTTRLAFGSLRRPRSLRVAR